MLFSFYSRMRWFVELPPNQQIIVTVFSLILLAILIIIAIKNTITQKQACNMEIDTNDFM